MENRLQFNYNARYFTLGEPGSSSWLVCHGYGQLASYFIRHFQPLAEQGHYIVAPEGLSRFYLQGTGGRVGASWMTREDRLSDIQNYLTMLDALALQTGLHKAPELNLLGFSQGVATICRWAMHHHLPIKRMVLWAGVFPPDVSPELSSARLQNTNLYQVWGDQDPYLDESAVQNQTQYLQDLNPLSFQNLRFTGAHQLHAPTLLQIGA